MISVTLDEEIVELFKDKFEIAFEPRVRLTLYLSDGEWRSAFNGWAVFKPGRSDYFQFDHEFTDWIKMHRPEVFL